MTKTEADLLALYVSSVALFTVYLASTISSWNARKQASVFYDGTIVPLSATKEAITSYLALAVAASVVSIPIALLVKLGWLNGITRAFTTSVLALLTFRSFASAVQHWYSSSESKLTIKQAFVGQALMTMVSVIILCGYMLAASLWWSTGNGSRWTEYGALALVVVVISSAALAIMGSTRMLVANTRDASDQINVDLSFNRESMRQFIRTTVSIGITLLFASLVASFAFQEDGAPVLDERLVLGLVIAAALGVAVPLSFGGSLRPPRIRISFTLPIRRRNHFILAAGFALGMLVGMWLNSLTGWVVYAVAAAGMCVAICAEAERYKSAGQAAEGIAQFAFFIAFASALVFAFALVRQLRLLAYAALTGWVLAALMLSMTKPSDDSA